MDLFVKCHIKLHIEITLCMYTNKQTPDICFLAVSVTEVASATMDKSADR